MSELTIKEKEIIRENLREYCGKFLYKGKPSQNKAAVSLDVSAGTVSEILNDNWDRISDDMFNKIATKIGATTGTSGWQIVETNFFKYTQYAFDFARKNRTVKWITGGSGYGKTTAAKIYEKENECVYYIGCYTGMRSTTLFREIARAAGIATNGCTEHEIIELIASRLDKDDVKAKFPLIILDEADKLSDNAFYSIIEFYNQLENYSECELKCGIVFMSTSAIAKRIYKGIANQTKGFEEFSTRSVGYKYYEPGNICECDVIAICKANGVLDGKSIEKIIKENAPRGFQLRGVKSAILAAKQANKHK